MNRSKPTTEIARFFAEVIRILIDEHAEHPPEPDTILCDVCGLDKTSENSRTIMESICACEECVDKILLMHMYSSPIPSLCPNCHNNPSNSINCDYCRIDALLQRTITGNISDGN